MNPKTKKQVRKSGRRTKSKAKIKTMQMKFIQTNCDRFTSKKKSLDEIMDHGNPDVNKGGIATDGNLKLHC